jgi:DNA polymerase-3 subunit gamma/tau
VACEAGDGEAWADWDGLIGRLGLKGTAQVLASHSVLERLAEGQFVLRVDHKQEHLHTQAAEDKIREALGHFFGTGVNVRLEFGKLAAETPAVQNQRASEERQQQANEAIDSDPLVREMKSTFDAEVLPGSVRPADS